MYLIMGENGEATQMFHGKEAASNTSKAGIKLSSVDRNLNTAQLVKESMVYFWTSDDYETKRARETIVNFATTFTPIGGVTGVAGKAVRGVKLLNQVNSAESLINVAGKLTRVKAGMQGFVKGDGPSIYKAITQGGKLQSNGQYLMPNGMLIGNHISKTTGIYTIHITTDAGKMIKIRVTP